MRGENTNKETVVETLRRKRDAMRNHPDERGRRIWAASEAEALGHGGVTIAHEATGMSGSAITQGIAETAHPQDAPPPDRERMSGGGRKKTSEKHPHYERELENLPDSSVAGDPEKTLRHASKSAGNLSEALKAPGIEASPETVRTTLKGPGYKTRGNRKVKSGGADHPDRDTRFQHIKRLAKRAVKSKNPVISVDTRKKEVPGAYKNGGKEWHRKGGSPAVADHDFIPPDAPRAYPYGIYDLNANSGFVNAGTGHDTSRFAVASIRAWRRRKAAPHIRRRNICRSLLMAEVPTAPGGGNGNMSRRGYRMKPVFRYGCAIIRREPAGGQNRTLFVSVHRHELARGTVDRLSNHGGFDKKHQNPNGSQCPMPIRHEQVRLGCSYN